MHSFPITKILFTGNSRVPGKQLLAALKLEDESILNRDISNKSELLLAVEHAKQQIQTVYTNEGYLYARIDSFQIGLATPPDSAQGFQLSFFITEGEEYKIGSIEIRGAKLFPEPELLSQMTTVPGEVLNQAILKADIDKLLALYEEHGYPLSKISIDAITPSYDITSREGLLAIRLHIEEGPRAKIGRIVITGNETTNADVILRELALRPGTYYNADALASARARVERLGFFESVSEPELYLDKDSTMLILLRVKEASTSAIDGVLGYNPPQNATESGYISGLVDLSLRNISGTGRNATLHYDRTNAQTQTLEVHYLEPWLFGYPLNLAVGFAQRQQDSTYTETSATDDLSLALTQDLRIIGNLSYDRVIPSDQPNMPFSVYDSRTVSTGLSASVDTRDNSIAPRYGVVGLLGASYGIKDIYGPSQFIDSATPASIGLRTISLDANGYHTLFTPNLVGAIGLHARSVSAIGGPLDVSDMFRIGGIFTIRGYREEDLIASRYAYSNLELRIMMSQFSYFGVFFDGGYLAKDSTATSPAEQPQYPMSYGIGAQLESPIGIIAVNVGLARGVPITQAIFAFGLVKQF
ncbi:MAG TPA: POTRA domain-containing protein [Candidatus Kapabacteria bacterium]|nr:POTRA domain-containing protein [Candidatus Kapabacteria bacterium]